MRTWQANRRSLIPSSHASKLKSPAIALNAISMEAELSIPADHDAYIAAAPEDLRSLLALLRAQLARALPDAEEVIAYKMPGFRIGRSIVAGYAAFSKQCGLYLTPSAITAHRAEIAAAGLKATKTGVTFSPTRPIPPALWRNSLAPLEKRSRRSVTYPQPTSDAECPPASVLHQNRTLARGSRSDVDGEAAS